VLADIPVNQHPESRGTNCSGRLKRFGLLHFFKLLTGVNQRFDAVAEHPAEVFKPFLTNC
jgi:hypothetical protein